MEWIIWVIVIVLIIAIVWWLMRRGNTQGPQRTVPQSESVADLPEQAPLAGGGMAVSAAAAGTTGLASAAGFSAAAAAEGSGPAEPEGTTADEPDDDWSTPAHASATAESTGPASAPQASEDAGPAAAATVSEPAEAAAPPAGDGGDVDEWETAPTPSEPSDADAEAAPGAAATPGAAAGVTADDVSAVDTGAVSSATGETATEEAATAEAIGAATPSMSPADAAADRDEWEASWSEGSQTPAHHAEAPMRHAEPVAEAAPVADAAPVHHKEYTDPHAPTLPGAESAAAEALAEQVALAEQETPSEPKAAAEPATEQPLEEQADAGQALTESGGHLAADQPYGEGSAAPGPNGSAPEGYTVKGNAGAMTYHDEDSASYDEATADVWFVSVAHAEAAGFRPPRRNRH